MNQYEEELRFALDDCDTEDGVSRLFLALAGMMRDRRRPERIAVKLERLAYDGVVTQESRELKRLQEAVEGFFDTMTGDDIEWPRGADTIADLVALGKHLTADHTCALVSTASKIETGEQKRVKGVMQPVYRRVSLEERVADALRARFEDLEFVELALLLGSGRVQRVDLGDDDDDAEDGS